MLARFASQGLERGLVRAPQGWSHPQWLELENKRKIKNKGGGIFMLQEHNTEEYHKHLTIVSKINKKMYI